MLRSSPDPRAPTAAATLSTAPGVARRRARAGRATGAALVVGSVLLSANASAEPTASLRVDRGPGAEICPDAPELARRVNVLVDHRALRTDDAVVVTDHFDVAITARDRALDAELRVSGRSPGVRSVSDESGDCGALADALAVTLAVLLRDTGHVPAAPTFLRPPPAAAGPPEAPRPSPGPPTETRVELGVGSSLGLPPHGRPTFGIAGSIGTTPGWRLGVGALVVPPAGIDVPPGAIETWLVTSTVDLCRSLDAGAVGEFGLCGEGAAGLLHGRAKGGEISDASGASRAWWALGVGGRFDRPLAGPIGYGLRLSALVPAPGEAFSIKGAQGSFTPWKVVLFGGLAISYRGL